MVSEIEGDPRLHAVIDGTPMSIMSNSESLLQELYVRLHRALFRADLLPIGGTKAWGEDR